MKYKKVLIIPYFGRFPSYFQLWLNSCSHNKGYYFYIYTDINIDNYTIPSNVCIKSSTLKDISEKASVVLGKKTNISAPYKLCDFRPLYGLIFSEDIKEFDFWGHCDLDLIFGNINDFLPEEIFDKYDKILTCGHFSLYRNDVQLNNLIKNEIQSKYVDIFTSDNNNLFDEGIYTGLIPIYEKKNVMASTLYDYHHNINQILYNNHISIYVNFDIYADISTIYDGLRLVWGSEISTRDKDFNKSFFYYKDGHVMRKIEGGEKTVEYMYIHLQKRKMDLHVNTEDDAFLIKSHSFEELPLLTSSEIMKLCHNGKEFLGLGTIYTLLVYRIHFYLSWLKYKTGINLFALFFWKKS